MVGHLIVGFLMVAASLFALVLFWRGYDWAIDKFEYLLFEANYPTRLLARVTKRLKAEG